MHNGCLLFSQKKTKKQLEQWNTLWDKYGKELGLLKTRVIDYVKYFVKGDKLNKKWAKDVVPDIEKENFDNIKTKIQHFLKDCLTEEDEALEVKPLLEKYSEEIDSVSKFEKETDVFGFYNAWWVFGEVAKELDYDIFMAEAENVGYKKTKRGENPMPNDLFDLEYAPHQLDTEGIINAYDKNLKYLNELLTESTKELETIEKKIADKETDSLKKKADKLTAEIEAQKEKIEGVEAEKAQVVGILEAYYDSDKLKTDYSERTDEDLINHFKNSVLSRYKSDDIVLRTRVLQTILDNIRKEVIWE